MSKSLRDILLVLMQIEMNFNKLYTITSVLDGKYSSKIKTITAVLAREEASHYEWYENLLEQNDYNDIKIEDKIYEIARKNLDSFYSSISRSDIHADENLIQTAYDYEIKNEETLREIYNAVKEEKCNEKETLMKFLEDIIKTEESHAANLKMFIRI